MEARFCPNCGSTQVEPDTSNRWAMGTFGGNPNEWMCRECDYTGLMPEGGPEEDFEEEAENLEFEPGGEYSRVDIEATPRFMLYFLLIILVFSVAYAVYLMV